MNEGKFQNSKIPPIALSNGHGVPAKLEEMQFLGIILQKRN